MRYLPVLALLALLFGCDLTPADAPDEHAVSYEEIVLEVDPVTAAREATELRAAAAVEVDPALKLTLWASDSLVNDPIAISIAPDGKLYYTRAERMSKSEFDVRGHMDWTEDIMALQSIEDKRAFLRRTFTAGSEQSEEHLDDLNKDGVKDWRDLAVQQESVWAVSDRNGDGVADRAQRYLSDFADEATDVANGIEYFDGDVFVTVAPDFWKATDADGDGTADRLESLATGFGVHIGFGGHGLSGPTVGPMGRLWWGIGDIGGSITDRDGNLHHNPNSGVIVRCDPDGGNFEVFAHGLRNTHEFAFDAYGNLVSVDNDGDHAGERERLVYLIDGSDTGWRINWQYGKYTDPKNNGYKVWMDEGMHLPRHDGQAAYFLPPLQNYVNGPTGLVFNPGTALGSEWTDHFFVAEFRGGPSNSPVHAFTMEPDGAGMKLGSTKEIVRGILPTGMDFGPDGALYFGDWINGWGAKKKGKIWKLDVGAGAGAEEEMRQQTAELLTRDFSEIIVADLLDLLGHPDRRVRQRAQFTLAGISNSMIDQFRQVAVSSDNRLARIHAIWGMGQMIRQRGLGGELLLPLLTDLDSEIVAQTARVVGDQRVPGGEKELIDLLTHRSPRVRFFAAEALGRLGEPSAIGPLVEMLRDNDDEDLYLRQAAMIALGRIGQPEPLVKLIGDPSRAVRTAAVVALRRIGEPRIYEYLYDRDPYVVAEAARAIHDDFSISEAMPRLAAMLGREKLAAEVVLRRAISANLRLGDKGNADQLLAFANRADASAHLRADALLALGTWAEPSVFDRVTGRYRGEVTRDAVAISSALCAATDGLLTDAEPTVRVAAITVAGSFGCHSEIVERILRTDRDASTRAAAVSALAAMGVPNLDELLLLALKDRAATVRSRALELLPESAIAAERTVALYREVIEGGTTGEAQTALAGLGQLTSDAATGQLRIYFDRLRADDFPAPLRLDLVAAIADHDDDALGADLDAYEREISALDSLGFYVYALTGGNPDAGSGTFYWNSAGQCTRCHAAFEYGGNVGPGLETVAARLSPREILTSIVHPSAAMAPGYETVLVTLNDESMLSGILLERNEDSVTIRTGKTDTRTIPASDIAELESLPSSMPSAHGKLSRLEIRDLVAWLAKLKG